MHFTVSQEPRLRFRMLCPRFPKREILPLPTKNPTYSVFWARNAIFHCLNALHIIPGDKILVPSYHCASAVEPILQYGAEVIFYNVKRDCSVDFADIEAKIDRQTRAVLVIHYFGFPQPIQKIQDLCAHRKLYLVEDCAHVLSGQIGGGDLGSFGDVSIFSWRKFLPIYDGGYLVINNPKIKLEYSLAKHKPLLSLKVAKNVFDKLIDDSVVKGISRLLRFLYGLARYLMKISRGELDVLRINNRSVDFDISLVNLQMSGLSNYILRNIDLSAVIKKRRMNYLYLLKELSSLPRIVPLFREIPEGLCPWVFPVLINSCEDFHLVLRSRGISAFTWGGVIHPKLPLDEFPDATYLYQNLVLLPIHQDLANAEMQSMIRTISEALMGWNSTGSYQLAGGTR